MFSSDTLPNEVSSAIARKQRREGEPRRAGDRAVLDPFYIFARIWSSRKLVVATTLLGIAIAVLYALAMPKMYTATTQILVDPREIKVVQNEVTPNGLPSEATLALIESQVAVIYSNTVLSRVVDAADLTEDPEFNGTAAFGFSAMFPEIVRFFTENEEESERTRRLMTIAKLRDRLAVSREAKSFVLNVAVESSDPGKAARLSQLISDTFMDELGRVQSETARRATTELTSRLEELREDVVRAERSAEEYKARNALIGVGGRLIDDAYILQVNEQLATTRANITALRVRATSMRNASVDDVVEGTLPEELTSQALARLRSTYADLAHQAAALRTKLGPRHPQRIASEQALDAARNAIAAELDRIVEGAQTELRRAVQTERNLTEQIDALKSKQITTSGAFVRLRELEREVEASRAVYEAFLLRARETGEQQSLNTANVRVISAATPPLQPSSISRKTIVLVGAILGFLAGIFIATASATASLIRDRMNEPRPAPAPVAAEAPLVPGHFAGNWNFGMQYDFGGLAPVPAEPRISPAAFIEGDERRRFMDVQGPADASAGPRDAQAGEDRVHLVAATPLRGAAAPAPAALPGEDSEALRHEIRMIAERRPASADGELEEDSDPDTLKLRRDIETVKEAIADLRRRRTEQTGQAAAI